MPKSRDARPSTTRTIRTTRTTRTIRRVRRVRTVAVAALLAIIAGLPAAVGAFAADPSRPLKTPSTSPVTPPPADSLRVSADSLTVSADSLGGLPDSLAAIAFGDSAAALEAPRAGLWWRADYRLARTTAGTPRPAATRAELTRSSAMYFSELIEAESPLGLFAAGSPGAYDTPYAWGPGTDRFSFCLAGQATAGAGVPEGLSHTLSPLLSEAVFIVHPDPVFDPLGQGSDGAIYASLPDHVPQRTPSAFRLTEGPSGSGTEDLILARRVGAWGVQGSYAHANAAGRYLYDVTKFQNLYLAVDRAESWGGLRAVAAGRHGQVNIENHRKLLWEAEQLSVGGQWLSSTTYDAELVIERRNDLTRWWSVDENIRRRSTSTGATLIGRRIFLGTGEALASIGIEHTQMSYGRRHVREQNWSRTGMGLAMGWVHATGPWSYRAAVGYSDPWWQSGHLRAHLDVAYEPGTVWGGFARAWSGGTQQFVPRAEPDGVAALERGLFFPGGEDASTGGLRRVTELVVGMRLRAGPLRLETGPEWRRIENGIGLRGDQAARLVPADRESLQSDQLLSDADLWAWQGSGRIDLLYGFALEGSGRVMLTPRTFAELPVFQPGERGQVSLVAEGSVFRGDLLWQGVATVVYTGSRTSPYGELPEHARLDLEGRGRIRDASFFMALHNALGDPSAPGDWGESATYDDGWMPLPGRGYRMGIEWHFLD